MLTISQPFLSSRMTFLDIGCSRKTYQGQLGESFTTVSFDGALGISNFVDISLSSNDENKMLLLTRQSSNSEVWEVVHKDC